MSFDPGKKLQNFSRCLVSSAMILNPGCSGESPGRFQTAHAQAAPPEAELIWGSGVDTY